jgi:hypothetical protein
MLPAASMTNAFSRERWGNSFAVFEAIGNYAQRQRFDDH